MDSDQFDMLVSRVASQLTRRRGLGLLAVSGIAGSRLVPEAEARKRKKKGKKKGKPRNTTPPQPTCSSCPTCQQCQSGGCVPVANGTACGSGNLCDSGTCRAPRCGDPGQDCRIFISSKTYTGNLGGLAGADAKCQALADAAAIEGTYMAWLSDSSVSPATRFSTKSSSRYVLLNGTKVANNWADLTDGRLDTMFTVSDAGNEGASGPGQHAWTGTRSTGEGRGGWCRNWTSDSSADRGLTGYHRKATLESGGSAWTDYDEYPCNSTLHLYCFQQS